MGSYDHLIAEMRVRQAAKGAAPNPVGAPVTPRPVPLTQNQAAMLYAHGGPLHPNPCGCGVGGAAPASNPHIDGVVLTQGPNGGICVPTNVGTITCDAPLAQRGSTVQAQACAVAPQCPPMTVTVRSCEPMVLVECEDQQIFIVRNIDGAILTFTPSTCDFSDTPLSGCVPQHTSPLLAVCDTSDPTNPDAFVFFVCTAEGIFVWNAGAGRFESDPCFPIRDCRDIRCVTVDNSGSLPVFHVLRRPTADDLEINVTSQFCVPAT